MYLICIIHYLTLTSAYWPPDKVCISGASKWYLNGMYQLDYWDRAMNGPIYYNSITHEYIYPNPTRSLAQYVIDTSIHRSDDPYEAYSNLWYSTDPQTYKYNPNDFIFNWKSYDPSISSYSSEPNMTMINCEDICVTEASFDLVNGLYSWQSFDIRQGRNASIYYCSSCSYGEGYYLYGREDVDNWLLNYNYNIENNPISCHVNSSNDNAIMGQYHLYDIDECGKWVAPFPPAPQVKSCAIQKRVPTPKLPAGLPR